jgi:hypothetical protein
LKQELRVSQKNKSPGPYGFTSEYYQNFREEKTPALIKLYHEMERGEILPNSFYEASTTLIQKSDKDTHTHTHTHTHTCKREL